MARLARTFFVSLGLLMGAMLWPQTVQAQDDKNGFIYFKMGANSDIASSAIGRNVNLGFGGGFRPFQRVSGFYLEPSLSLNWPKKEILAFDGFPLQVFSKTIWTDFNGSFVLGKNRRFVPYLTGGIGFLRNGDSATDGYYRYNLGSDTHFTRNAGTGLRYFRSENFFIGFEARRYWAKDSPFRSYTASIGFRF